MNGWVMGVEEFNFSECNENQEIGAITFKYIHIIVG